MASRQYRTIFLSDAHLGIRESKAEFLLDFLQTHDADRYFLVGDIFDGWALRRSWYWPESHNNIIQMLLEKAKSASMTYIPGNHDEAARRFPGLRFGGITIQKHVMHTTADGRRFLVMHGDEFDGMICHARWISHIGAWAYLGLLKLNHHVNRVRRWMKLPYWSVSAYLKNRTKKAVQFIADFENAVAKRAQTKDADGVICGHIHHPEMLTIHGVQYVNTGDWVESCTALVEHHDGTLEILRWIPSGHGTATSLVRGADVSGDGQVTGEPIVATA